MSSETIEWLEANVLVGNVHDRAKYGHNGFMVNGRPWFATAGYSGAYEGFVPVDDVVAKLYGWDAVEAAMFFEVPCSMEQATGLDGDGSPVRRVQSSRKAIVRSDSGAELGAFKDGYRVHQFRAWLLDGPAALLDAELGIDSAGLLQGGAQSWVSVTLPEAFETSFGFSFRPSLLAVTSHNGTLATGYHLRELIPVCDNSLRASLRSEGSSFKVKHTRNSGFKLGTARDALGLLLTSADEMADEIRALCEWDVSERDFLATRELLVPVPAVETDLRGKVTNTRTVNGAERKRGELLELWCSDPRVSPWRGSALGVVQAFNTWHLWGRNAKVGNGGGILERNFGELVTGTQEHDASVLAALARVQGRDLVTV